MQAETAATVEQSTNKDNNNTIHDDNAQAASAAACRSDSASKNAVSAEYPFTIWTRSSVL